MVSLHGLVFRYDFVAIIWLLLAVGLTIHILLSKREASAAIGWIGVCWLMPFLGICLYMMFGINRVQRLARKLVQERESGGYDVPSSAMREVAGNLGLLSRAVQKITGRPLLEGNRVVCLQDGDNAYPQMLAAIEGAESSVFLASYIFRYDGIGRRFCDALAAAHDRGVTVRVLVDGIGSGYVYCPVFSFLRRRGVPVARFMHSFWPWRMPFINLRNHKKILVVDGVRGFMGGLNIGGENILKNHPKSPVSDTHFCLEGPAVHQLTEAFLRDWYFTTGEDMDGKQFFPECGRAGSAATRVVVSGPDDDQEKIEFTMMQAIGLAQRSVCLMTPYFLPGSRFLNELALAAMRGVEIDIVMPQRSNHRLLDWARDANNDVLLMAGCRLWLARPPFNHSKLMVVDDTWSFIGSANLDVRSLRLNFEINLEIYEESFSESLRKRICAHRHIEVTKECLDSRSFPVRLRDASARLLLPYL